MTLPSDVNCLNEKFYVCDYYINPAYQGDKK